MTTLNLTTTGWAERIMALQDWRNQETQPGQIKEIDTMIREAAVALAKATLPANSLWQDVPA